jgi:hypothetical protein
MIRDVEMREGKVRSQKGAILDPNMSIKVHQKNIRDLSRMCQVKYQRNMKGLLLGTQNTLIIP